MTNFGKACELNKSPETDAVRDIEHDVGTSL